MQIINSSRRGRSVLASPFRSLAFAATFALMFGFASASASASASAFAFAYAFAFALAVASALGLLSASAVVAADNSRPNCRDARCVSHFWHVLCQCGVGWEQPSPTRGSSECSCRRHQRHCCRRQLCHSRRRGRPPHLTPALLLLPSEAGPVIFCRAPQANIASSVLWANPSDRHRRTRTISLLPQPPSAATSALRGDSYRIRVTLCWRHVNFPQIRRPARAQPLHERIVFGTSGLVA